MKKTVNFYLLLICLVLVPVLAAAGCQPGEIEEEEFDRDALMAVDTYIVEMGEALKEDTLRADLQGWVRGYYEDDLPFYYDEERREWLNEHLVSLEKLKRKHLEGSDFPSKDEIAEWDVVVVRGEEEWQLEGEEVLSGLGTLNELYDEMIAVITMIIDNEGELTMEQSERVLTLLDEIEPAVKEARSVFKR